MQNIYLARIRQLMNERKWNDYKLAQSAGIPKSTISSLFERNNAPTVGTLEKICAAFGISVEQFFCPDGYLDLTEQQKSLLDAFSCLGPDKREAALSIMLKIVEEMNQLK